MLYTIIVAETINKTWHKVLTIADNLTLSMYHKCM